VTGRRRVATVSAETDAVLVRLPRALADEVLSQDLAAALRLAEVASERMTAPAAGGAVRWTACCRSC
jgi:CRP-like cAMP-binding protein